MTAVTEVAAQPPARGAKSRPTGWGLLAASMGFLVPVAFSPALRNGFFGPKYAFVLVAAGVGGPVLVHHARRSVAHQAAVAFLALALVSVLVNGQPALSFLGRFNLGTGWVLLAGSLGAWAVGAMLGDREASLVRWAIVAAAMTNAVVALVGAVTDLRAFGIGEVGGRPVAFMGNPVHVGALMITTLALLGHGAERGALVRPLVAAVPLGVGLGVTGSRAALLGLPLVALGLARTSSWRRALAIGATFAVAVLGSGVLVDAGQDVVSRASTEGSDAAERPASWALALDAIADRPVFGRGPGRFREATTIHRTEANLDLSSDTYFDDAHNVVLELATTTGLVGVAAASLFVALAGRRARGPFAWFCAGAVPYLLLQPLSVAFTPVLALALGVAGRPLETEPTGRTESADTSARTLPRLVAVGSMVGALGAALVGASALAGSFFLRRTYQDFAPSDARLAERLLGPWPEGAIGRGQPAAFESSASNAAAVAEGLSWYREAARRNPDDPQLWMALADYELSFDRLGDAKVHYRRALQRDPVSLRARWGLAIIASRRGDLARAEALLEEARRLRPEEKGTGRLRDRLLG